MNRQDRIQRMREAAVHGRAALQQIREAVQATERVLAEEERRHADAERRGRLAADIGDHETVVIAEKYARQHAERGDVYRRKLEAQRAELALAERDVAGMVEELRRLEAGLEPQPGTPGDAPGRDGADDPLLKYRIDQAAKEAAADEMLKELKKRMGK